MSTGLYKSYAQDHAGTGFVEFEYSTKPIEYTEEAYIPEKVRLLYDTQHDGT
ncbi:MAG: hypothetical protein MJ195_03240 [Mycoplasmoidaceae bacterium]|nr:hypothetical protein [Mycoplasmoidaceae bacterium]